jgi:hypothetical protein
MVTKSFIALDANPFDSEAIKTLCCAKLEARSNPSLFDGGAGDLEAAERSMVLRRWQSIDDQHLEKQVKEQYLMSFAYSFLGGQIQPLDSLRGFVDLKF